MADINLTEGADTYVQPESARSEWNNYFALGGNDWLRVFNGTVIGGRGDDRIEQLANADPWQTVQVAYWDSPAGVRVDLAAGTADDGWGGHDTLVGIDGISGSNFDDWLSGNSGNNDFWPGMGVDIVFGGAGSDQFAFDWFDPGNNQAWRHGLLADLNVQVAVDGLSAVITPQSGGRFSATLYDVEFLRVQVAAVDDWQTLPLADFIKPQDMAVALTGGGDLRWNAAAPLGTAVNVSFSFVQQAPASGVGASGFRAFTAAEQQAVRDILAQTSQLAGISFAEVPENGNQVGQMRFGVSQQAATKGVAFLPNQAGAGDQAGDVWMDRESMAVLAPGSEGYAALLHEIGHSLGLRHPRNVDAGDHWAAQWRAEDDRSALTAMSEVPSADGLWRADWSGLDILALRTLYGSHSSNAGDTMYRLGTLESSAQTTLLDDGGNDTLDASAGPVGARLDLAPGHLSSFGLTAAGMAAVDNLAVAPGSWLENAIGTAFDDVLLGNELANQLTGGAGNDWLDGGKGMDIAAFAGPRAAYATSSSYGKLYVQALDGVSGFDTLLNIERLQFSESYVAMDLGGHAGQAAQIIRALFGPAMLHSTEFAGYGVIYLDRGMPYSDLVNLAIGTDYFLGLAHSRSNSDFVKLVYQNVVGVAPSADDLGYYVGLLDSGAYTQTSLGVLAAQIDVNAASAELLGLASTGLDYIFPPGI